MTTTDYLENVVLLGAGWCTDEYIKNLDIQPRKQKDLALLLASRGRLAAECFLDGDEETIEDIEGDAIMTVGDVEERF